MISMVISLPSMTIPVAPFALASPSICPEATTMLWLLATLQALVEIIL